MCGAKTYPPEGDVLVRFTEPRRSRWVAHTKESFYEYLAELERVKDSPEDLKEMEIHTGINYNPHSLLWDAYTLRLVNAPHCQYWDGMHCLFSSGGIVQYELNGFVSALYNRNIELAELDHFAKETKGHRLGNDFFTNRIVKGARSRIKALSLIHI